MFKRTFFLAYQELDENSCNPILLDFRQKDAPGQIDSSTSFYLHPLQRETHWSAARLQGLNQLPEDQILLSEYSDGQIRSLHFCCLSFLKSNFKC